MKPFIVKSLAVAALTLIATPLWAGRDGGGGDSGSKEVVDTHDIRRAIKVQKFFQPQVYQALKSLAQDKAVKAAAEGRREELSADYKLILEMSEFPNSDQLVASVNYKIQEQPCLSDGQPSDSSAVLPNTVCFSLSRLLSHQYAPSDLLKEVTALATHEIAHLMHVPPSRHDEIAQLQSTTRWRIGSLDTHDLLYDYIKLSNNMTQEFAFLNIHNNKASVSALCSAAAMAFTGIVDAEADVDRISDRGLRVGFPIGAQADAKLAEASFRIINVQLNGCGLEPADPVLSQMKDLFAHKKQLSAYEIQFAVQHAFMGTAEADYLAKDCGFSAGINCEGGKKIILNKIKRGDVNAIYAELQRAEQAYRDYYKIALSLAKRAEKMDDEMITELNHTYIFP